MRDGRRSTHKAEQQHWCTGAKPCGSHRIANFTLTVTAREVQGLIHRESLKNRFAPTSQGNRVNDEVESERSRLGHRFKKFSPEDTKHFMNKKRHDLSNEILTLNWVGMPKFL
jgi:hypothetical protein